MIESRSIDYIPDAERHGGLASQFTVWLSANLQITAMVTRAVAELLVRGSGRQIPAQLILPQEAAAGGPPLIGTPATVHHCLT